MYRKILIVEQRDNHSIRERERERERDEETYLDKEKYGQTQRQRYTQREGSLYILEIVGEGKREKEEKEIDI